MMLIRISGGSEGIEDYLQHGQKKGRDFDRNELDERVILDGDLDTTREIISTVHGDGEKYLHVTLAFKEDEVSKETLHAITQEFKEFAFAAYDPDEFNFYAEAHLPRIKSYIHQQTGEFIERKPHVHAVIPELNLLSGHKLNPFGRAEHQIKFLEAFQEHINDKYGLASPKDNRRIEFTGESEMIGRYKGDIFAGQNKEFREQVLTEMIGRGITSYDEFRGMLEEFGDVKIRNKGKETEYLNVKRPGAEKGVNLKDSVFRREFVELTPKEKAVRLAVEARQHYATAGPPRPMAEHWGARLTEWRTTRAREVKYLNPGNRKLYQRYREAPSAQRRDILNERETRFYSKYRDTERGIDIEVPGKLSAIEGRGAGPVKEGNTAHGRRSDSVTGQLAHELDEGRQQHNFESLGEWQEIKQQLEPYRLLSRLSESHGVIPDKYDITTGQDGTPRIRAGTRNLNVSDFLTKELNLPWSEASGILREVYAEQTGRDSEPRCRQPPTQQLWQEYQEHRATRRAAQWEEQRTSESTRRQALKREWYARRSAIQGNRMLKGVRRKAALSVARMERVIQAQALSAAIKTERTMLRTADRAPMDQYREFLRAKSEAGDGRALAELRRVQRRQGMPASGLDAHELHIEAADRSQANVEAEPLQVMPGLSYSVNAYGDVTYRKAGAAILRDEGRAVRVLRADDDDIETALRLARAKFGTRLILNGSEAFQAQAARVAAERGIGVEFADPRLQALMSGRKAEIEAERKPRKEVKSTPGPAPKNSVEPNTRAGRYTGPIAAVDEEYVYQQHGRDIIRHARSRFPAAPAPGDTVRIMYLDERITIEQGKALKREKDRGR
jgi:hypothetical protein